MKKFTTFAVAMLTIASAAATNLDFSYNLEGANPSYYGTGKKENYDVAVRIDNPSLKGAKITKLSVALPGEPELYSAASAFLTTELKVERVDGVRVNVADICTVDATIADGMLTATFADPYTLTEDPIYIGYSFEIAELVESNKLPVAVVPGNNPEGFWFHSSRTQLKWSSYVNKQKDPMQSALTITLEGDFVAESAGVILPERFKCLTGQENPYTFTVVNGGSAAINNINYTWSINGKEGAGEYTFATPIRGALGALAKAELTLPVETQKGEYPLTVTITKVNGVDNPNLAASDVESVIFSPVIPVMRPLIEEYTGLWCGWCPRGYAALEYMGEEYGHDFVAAAWHNGDQMTITNNYPNNIPGFPAAYANRTDDIDLIGIEELWPTYCAEETNFSIGCYINFTDDYKIELKATSYVTSVADTNDAYTVGYLLVADDLKDPDWGQHNYYAGNYTQASAQMPEKYAEIFGRGEGIVYNLVFNDVVVNNDYVYGVMESLPAEIKAFNENIHEVTFNVTSIISSYNKEAMPIIKDKLRVLAFILDKKGKVVNSCSSAYPGQIPEAVENVDTDNEVVSTVWYDLQGRTVKTPANGIFVRIQTLSDGTIQTAKVAFK